VESKYVHSRIEGIAGVLVTPKEVIDWLKYDARTAFFTNAIQYINWERVEGDILEFGVSVGKSFALLAQLYRENLDLWQYTDPACTRRRMGGFDTFSGLPGDDGQVHPRWQTGSFGTNYLYNHPTLKMNEPITPQSIRGIFAGCGLPAPELEVGKFSDTLPQVIPNKYPKAALVHIDSDLYSSAKEVLVGVEPILQSGTIVCFDDWFMYRGDPGKGEARAFGEFLQEFPRWQAIPYQTYSVFCNSFIMHRR
jgi:O-methyltransferase